MSNNELTGDYVLEISDFSDPEEVDDLKEMWDEFDELTGWRDIDFEANIIKEESK